MSTERDKHLPSLYTKTLQLIEYIYTVFGFFLVAALVSGLVFSTCTDNHFIAMIPILLFLTLMLYIVLTTLGRPLFMLLGQLPAGMSRRVLTVVTIVTLLLFILFSGLPEVTMNLLMEHVHRFFPDAKLCEGGVFTIKE